MRVIYFHLKPNDERRCRRLHVGEFVQVSDLQPLPDDLIASDVEPASTAVAIAR